MKRGMRFESGLTSTEGISRELLDEMDKRLPSLERINPDDFRDLYVPKTIDYFKDSALKREKEFGFTGEEYGMIKGKVLEKLFAHALNNDESMTVHRSSLHDDHTHNTDYIVSDSDGTFFLAVDVKFTYDTKQVHKAQELNVDQSIKKGVLQIVSLYDHPKNKKQRTRLNNYIPVVFAMDDRFAKVCMDYEAVESSTGKELVQIIFYREALQQLRLYKKYFATESESDNTIFFIGEIEKAEKELEKRLVYTNKNFTETARRKIPRDGVYSLYEK